MLFKRRILFLPMCIALLSVKSSLEEIMIIKLKSEFYNSSLKYWFSYVRAFLHANLKSTQSNNSYVGLTLYSLSRARRFYNRCKQLNHFAQSNISSDTSCSVTHLCGMTDTTDPFSKTCGPKEQIIYNYLHDYQHTWQFTLDKHLRLNITFEYMTIFIFRIYVCNNGKVTVRSFNEYLKLLDLVYCGTHAYTFSYPPYQFIDIVLTVKIHTSYYVKFTYSIIDPQIFPNNFTGASPYAYPDWFVDFQYSKEAIQKIQIKVLKFRHILLELRHGFSSFEIYDGPGTLSKVLLPVLYSGRKITYMTTSFQCVLYEYGFSLLEYTFKYFSRKLNIYKNIYLSPENDSYVYFYSNRNLPTFDHVYLLRIATVSNVFVNVTVLGISHNYGDRNINCTFGGLTAYKNLQDNSAEISTVCLSETSEYKYRRIYSKSSAMFLLIYSYIEYGSFNLTSQFSTTKCIVRLHCLASSVQHPAFLEGKQCFICQMFNDLTLDLFYARSKYPTWTGSGRKMNLEFSYPSFSPKILQVIVTGYMTGNYSFLSVSGVADQLCWLKNNITNCRVLQFRKCEKNMDNSFFYKDFVKKNEESNFHIVLTSKRPNLKKQYRLYFGFDNTKQNTWADVAVILNDISINAIHPFDHSFIFDTVNTMNKNNTFSTVLFERKAFLSGITYDPLLYFHSFDNHSEFTFDVKVKTCSFFSSLHLNLKTSCLKVLLIWEGSIKLCTKNPSYMVSLFKPVRHLTLQSLQKNVIGVLKVYWVPIKTKFQPNFFKFCKPFVCLKYYEIPTMLEVYRLYFGNVLRGFNYYLNKLKGTWNEAYKLCKSVGGYLPIIRSRKEQDDIMNLHKQGYSEYNRVFPTSVIFIGLLDLENKKIWQTGEPVTFQQWKDTTRNSGIVAHKCGGILGECGNYWTNTQAESFEYHGRSVVGHPTSNFNLTCAAMLLHNLAYPAWITIPCNEPVTTDVLCHFENQSHVQHHKVGTKSVYNKSCVIKNDTCYVFIQKRYHSSVNPQKFIYLFDAVSVDFPPVAINVTHKLICAQYNRIYCYESYKNNHKSLDMFFIYRQHSWNFPFGSNVHICQNGMVVSIKFLCDGHNDCVNSSDEKDCVCQKPEHYSGRCKYHLSRSGRTRCAFYFFQTSSGHCEMYTSLAKYNLLNNVNNENSKNWKHVLKTKHGPTRESSKMPLSLRSFNCQSVKLYLSSNTRQEHTNLTCTCKTGIVIHISMVNDLIVNCGPNGDDEYYLKQIQNGVLYNCSHKHQIPCLKGHPRCYNISEICSYKLDQVNNLIPCRTGGHLAKCTEFECNMMFKCPNYYCIPWAYVCDGKWDCPFGIDENAEYTCHLSRHCDNMFKCRNSSLCIHLNDICNNYNDCPFGDDEQMCLLQNQFCPSECICLAFAVKCFNVSFSSTFVISSSQYHKIHIKNCDRQFTLQFVHLARNAVFLFLISNKLNDICSFLQLHKHLLLIDVSYNELKSIQDDCFMQVSEIRILNLSNNKINYISSNAFWHVPYFAVLNLSNNLLIQLGIFQKLHQLKVLLLDCTGLKNIHESIFLSNTLEFVHTSDFHLCCLLQNKAICLVHKPWYKSCTNLLTNISLEITFYALSVTVFLLGLYSITLHTFRKETRAGLFNLSVISINLTDITYGFYLTIMWIVDLWYGENLVLYEVEWRSSFFCVMLSTLALNYSLLSPVLHCFLTFVRLKSVVSPIDVKSMTSGVTKRYIPGIVFICGNFSVTITLILVFFYQKIPLSICSPFVDPTNSVLVMKVVTLFSVSVQITAIILIVIAFLTILCKLEKSRCEIGRHVSKKQSKRTSLYIQISISVLSHILCWLTSSTVYIVLMFIKQYPISIITWTIVAIVPINAIVNAPISSIVVTVKRIFRSA